MVIVDFYILCYIIYYIANQDVSAQTWVYSLRLDVYIYSFRRCMMYGLNPTPQSPIGSKRVGYR